MGVSGSGKTTIGRALADRIGWKFIESDDYHSEADIAKMSAGIPLTDRDRSPWLKELNKQLIAAARDGQSAVLACSALKASYRKILYASINDGVYVYLKGKFELIWSRMQEREHFMKADMLQSQFNDLEEPAEAVIADIRLPTDTIIDHIIDTLDLE